MVLKVVIEPGEDGMLIASVPALRGCHSQGATRKEVLENIHEAIEGWLETQQDRMKLSEMVGQVELVKV